MSYRALLFCPDEKVARTVTQVLSELEFTVEPCAEPFAAVKKLMGEHFDAVVVDCDNEQNAALLFKSARNSTSNQASLAVAVVEGQAGVAKAFRIGANLVLTKPINIEQSKGTLRVARGLLRKGEPAKAEASKPAAPAPGAPAPAPSAPAAPRPAAPKPAVPAAARPAATTTARPAVPAAKPAVGRPAVAASAAPVKPAAKPEPKIPEIPAIGGAPAIAASAPVAPVAAKPPALAKPAAPVAPVIASSGAASAPAPAREAEPAPVAEPAPAPEVQAPPAIDAESLFEKPVTEPAASESSYQPAAPSFSYGGSESAQESSGSKKIFLMIGAVAVLAIAAYFGWSYFQGRSAATPASSAPVSAPVSKPVTQPAATAPSAAPSVSTPAPAAPASSASNTQPAAQPVDTAKAASKATNDAASPDEEESAPAPAPSKSSASSKSTAAASAPAARILKGGKVPAQSQPAPVDAPAPSMMGIAPAGAPMPDLVGHNGNAPKPVLQTLNISQGVSRGLLIKKVQPQYPQNALAMHAEGTVELTATISASGNISAVKIVSGPPLLTKAAADAVKQWKYKPYLLNGQPVEIQTQVTVNFQLPH